MAARPAGVTSDLARGYRLKEVLEKILPNSSRSAKSRELGAVESSLRNWESGSNIDNRVLARIYELGGDVSYILTGSKLEKSPANSELTAAQVRVISEVQRLVSILLEIQKDAMADPEVADKYASSLSSFLKDIGA
jgi:hypothetical protein